MNSKIWVSVLSMVILITAIAIVNAALTTSPATTITTTNSLNSTFSSSAIVMNSTTAVTGVTFTYSGDLSYSSNGLNFEIVPSNILFNPSSINIAANHSNSTIASVFIPYDAYMGEYSTNITAGSGSDIVSFALNVLVKSTDYSKDLRINMNSDSYPTAIRVGSDFVIKKADNTIENRNSNDDAKDVVVQAWLYDETDNMIVSKEELNLGTVNDDSEEAFDDDIELSTDNLNSDHSFSLFMRAYSKTDPTKFFVEKEIEDNIDVRSEEDLCQAGDLGMDKLDEDDIEFHGDDISPGEKIIVPITITNDKSNTAEGVIVRAWICEDDSACTWDDSHLDDFKLSKLDAVDIGEGDDYTFNVPLEIPDDADEQTYRLRAEAFEKDDEDTECTGEDVSIKDVQQENEELIIDSISIPDLLNCGDDFTVDVKIKNIGDDDLSDISVRVRENSGKMSINKLSDALDIDSGRTKTYTFNFKVPTSIEAGTYTFVIQASNEDEDTETREIKVEGNTCKGILTDLAEITADPNTAIQSGGNAGEDLVVKASVKNLASEQLTFTILAAGFESWAAEKEISPRTLTLDAGETQDVLITLSVNDDVSGTQTFNIKASSDNKITEKSIQVPIQASSSGFGITGSVILENIRSNWFIWIIVAVNVILIVAIIIVASKLSK